MFHINQNLKVVLATEPVDLRKSFNGLYVIARNELGDVLRDAARGSIGACFGVRT
ncbi:MAG: hypothetical protein V5783_08385 [Pontiella sp.]